MQLDSIKSLLARSAMMLVLLALLPAGRALAATVTTDRTDYTPGMTVLITGAGWQPGETVTIHLDETPDVCPSPHVWTVVADGGGNITDESFTLDVIHIGVTFDLQATGQLSGFTASAVFTDAAANLDQARNGPIGSPNNPVQWVNGNVNASQAHMVEGFSVPYRMIITDLTNGSHTLVIEWDITASGGQHAIDYITHYDRLEPHNQFGAHTTPEAVNPTNGIAGVLLGPTTFPIPAPSSAGSPVPGQPTASFNALPAAERLLSIWNGTITSAVYLAEGNLAMGGEETRLEIKFTTTNSTVIIAWGGHIATKLDWGEGNSASGVSGSPYHMRLISIDGGGGNQDRSLQASAVRSPPSCPITGPTNVCAGTTNVFFASTDFGTNFLWRITNNTSGAFIVGLSNRTNVTVASGTGGSFLLQILVGSNFLSSVCEKLVTVVSNTTSAGPTNVALCTPSDVTFTTTPSGAGPFTFVWRRNGTLISGATSNSLTISNAMPANSGTYCVEVTGLCNSVTNCATLFVDTPPSIACPSNVTVQCFADVPAPNTNSVTASAGAQVTHEGDVAATNGCEIVLTRTYKAVNACGNMATCAQLITVRDTLAPVLTCASNRVVECGAAWSFDAPSATDNCLGTNVTIAIVNTVTNALCGNTFSATRTWEAVDACTNSARCSQTITVVDTTPPMLVGVPGPGSFQCLSDVPAPASVTATDACDSNPQVTLVSTTNGSCPTIIIHTWTATDACTNQASASQTNIVLDTTPPVLSGVPGNTNYQCLADVPALAVVTANDNCDGSVPVTVNCATNGTCPTTITCTWSAQDRCTNTVSATRTITIRDTTPPVITCPTNVTLNCADLDSGCTNGQFCTYTQGGWGSEPSGMNPGTILTNGFATVYPGGIVEIGLPGTNGFSMRFTAAAAIEAYIPAGMTAMPLANDYINPTNTEAGVFGGQVLALQLNVDFSAAGVTPGDTNCSFGDLIYTDPASPLFGKTVREILAIANIALGGGSVTNFDVTLGDLNELATKLNESFDNCVQSAWAKMNLMLPKSGSTSTDTGVATATDNCDPQPVITFMDEATGGSCLRTIRRTWTATDSCGNSNSCVQIISFQDTTPPTITCATNRTVECGDLWTFDEPTADDNCSGVVIAIVRTATNGLCGSTFSATRTWSATDQCGNSNTCAQTITVVDTMRPTLVGVPTNLTLRCLGDVPPPATVTATDACDTNVTVAFKSRTYGPCPTVIERIWTATDDCMNSLSATQTIFIQPDLLQVTATPMDAIVCPGGTAKFCVTATANCPITFQWYKGGLPIAGATNACLTLSNVGEADEGEYCVRINGEFCQPNEEEFFVPAGVVAPGVLHCARLTVLPIIAATPLADVTKCPGDEVTFCTTVSGLNQGDAARCPVTFVWTKDGQVLAGQTNSCLFIESVTPASAGLYCVIAHGCCNSVTNCARLTVPSNMIGVICPKNKKKDCDDDWDFDEPKGTNVNIVIVGTETNQLCGKSYTAVRTWLIGDQNCGSMTCTQKVTVEASLDIDCGPDKTVACGQSWDFDEPEVEGCNDDLDVDVLYTTTTTLSDGSVQHTRKWSVRDECGNEDTCKQIVTVRSGASAVVHCAGDKTVECGSEWSFDPPTVSGGTLRVVHTITNGACGGAYAAARLWEVTDPCGGSILCNQVVTIVDTLAPVLLKRPTNLVIECGPVPPPAMVFAVDAVSAAPGPQIVLTNRNIVGGSGSWEHTTWNDPAGGFNAFNIVDDQAGPVAEPAQDNYWLGPDTNGTQHIVIDLGKPFLIDRIELFNTHNHVFDDRGTKDFQIRAAHAVTNAGVRGLDLSGAADLILSNRLAFQLAADDPIEAEVFTADNGLAPCAAYRYLRFEALNGHGNGRVGLNEIRIYGRMVCDTNVPVHFTETRTDGLCPQSYTLTRTWGAADDCGNSNHCTQIITVVDTTPPVLTCLPDGLFQSITQVPACPKTLATFLAAGGAASDACDTNLHYFCEDGPFIPTTCGGVIERRHTVIDSCGNSNSCVQRFRIEGEILPVATPLADVTVCAGSAATFTTTVSGPGPFQFRWRHNGVLLPGETSHALSIPAANAAAAGSYSVEITGPCGSVTNAATLALAAATTATPLADLTRNTGESATFSTVAAGDGPFTYAWRHNGAVLAGQSGASLTLASVTQADAGTYTVEVSGRCNTVTNSAALTVIAPEPFLAQLISHWKLDEADGLLARDAVGSNHGDLIEGPLHCGGILGGALSLDGSDDCVEVPHSASLNLSNQFSISFWFRPAQTLGAGSGRRELVNKCLSYCVVLNAATNDGRLVFAFNSGTPAVKSTTVSWPANRWSHVVCVQDGAGLKLYVNGVLEGTTATSAQPRVIAYSLLFGGDPEQGGFFAGSMDDVRLYSTNLPPAAIATMFNAGSTAYYTPANLTVSVQREAGRATVSWGAIAGVRYRVEYKTDLGATQWTALPDDVMATSAIASKEDMLGANLRRFYRVIALP